MQKTKTFKIVMVLAVVALMGMGVKALAQTGYGSGYYGKGYHRGGWHYGGEGWSSFLSQDEMKRADAERQAFFKGTEDLRQRMYEKELELRTVLVKKDPDVKKAAALQKELSDLEAQFAQRRLEHVINMKKIHPDLGRGYPGGGMGKGYGPCGRGRCWR